MSAPALPVVDIMLDRRQLTSAQARAIRSFAEYRIASSNMHYRQFRGRNAQQRRAERDAEGYRMGGREWRWYKLGCEALGGLRGMLSLVADGHTMAETVEKSGAGDEAAVVWAVRIGATYLVQVYEMAEAG